MNTMLYKGYTARVEYDECDNLFVGRILGIRNIISFHGETVMQLRAEFEHAIGDYLAKCKQQGTELSSIQANDAGTQIRLSSERGRRRPRS